MQMLPSSFSKNGFTFTQLERRSNVALFSKNKPGRLHPSFETVIIQQNPPFFIHGKPAGDCESMPPSESWGSKGWTDTTEASARRRFLAHL